MSQIFYDKRCRCKENFTVTKKRRANTKSEGKPLPYPDSTDVRSKIFQIRYEKQLSIRARFLINSFANKYLYYVIDDILDICKSNQVEKEDLLASLYSPVLSLHNRLSINFFDIWVQEVYISKVPKKNKFLGNTQNTYEPFYYITLRLLYKPKVSLRKQSSLW